MKTLRKLIRQYYRLDNCAAGGPLHILLDDDNYDMSSIHFCMRYCFDDLVDEHHNKPEIDILGIMICNEYAKMSLEERAVFDSYLCGMSLQCKRENIELYTGSCDNCELLGELYEHMKETEEVKTE
jgi:hypothetical protein